MTTDSPVVTVLARRDVASPTNAKARAKGFRRGEVHAVPLHEALTREWPTDAHLTAYEPISVPVVNGSPGETMLVRHTREGVAEGIPARLNVLIGDVDGPGHTATPEWRVETEGRLAASGLAWYRTRNGYRVLEALPSAYVIESPKDEELWWEFYLGWRETVQERFGIELDPACKDWPRLYRLPNVMRDGEQQRSDVAHIESIPTFDLEQWHAPTVTCNTRPSALRSLGEAAPDAIERAIAIAERMPASIEGLRGDESLFKCARELAVELGEDSIAIHAILLNTFNPRCLPEWPEEKLKYEATRAAAAHATPEDRSQRRRDEMRAAQAPDPFHVVQPHGAANDERNTGAGAEQRSDLGNARRLVRMHGDRLRYFRAYRTWYVWTGTRWEADTTGQVERAAQEVADSLWEDARAADEEQRTGARTWALQTQNRARLDNMIAVAGTLEGIPVTADMLDADPWLLNVQNGTLDLRTGELSTPDPNLLMTKCAAVRYDPSAKSELWEAFVRRTTGGDAELATYMQRALGYALVGVCQEKHFWFGYGPPDGAKSTMLGVIGQILGDYHVSAEPSTWMVQSSAGGNRGDLTRLLGARLVTSLEIRKGLRFDEALVKKVTGGDRITAAAKYKDEIEFAPTFALWLGANDRPGIRDDDDGMWARMRCVPFTNPVPKAEQDPRLREKLTSPDHAPAILRWLVDGCLAWQRDGLGECSAVTKATGEYRREMNEAAEFVEEVLEITGCDSDEVPCSVLRERYQGWCREANVRRPLQPKALGQRLRELGVRGGGDATRHKVQGSKFTRPGGFGVERHWTGVRLRE
jgi:P4 family phage/plasmid primase-like protien